MDPERNVVNGRDYRAGRTQQRNVILRMGDINFVGLQHTRERRQHPPCVVSGTLDLTPGKVRPQTHWFSLDRAARVQQVFVCRVHSRETAKKAAPISPVAGEAPGQGPGINADSHK